MTAARPFDDIRNLVSRLPGPDRAAGADAAARLAAVVDAARLGRVGAIVEWLATWTGDRAPRVDRPLLALFAASGTVAGRAGEGDPVEVARDRVAALTDGTAFVNHVCATQDMGMKVFELALDLPTPDITAANALDENACAATIAYGMEAVAGGNDLLVLGSTGSGGNVAAAALLAALQGGTGADWISGEGAALADAAAARVATRAGDALDLLRRIGSRDIAALVGAILAARYERVPVILDGLTAAAAAAVVHALDAGAVAHCMIGDLPGAVAGRLGARLGLEPLLDLGLIAGEGTGAAFAAAIVRGAAVAAESLVELPGELQ
ncbi:MAG: nicotinate-nucleotide--dimethylbenzimidazole phosphoribosyltransferase [Hyphomicrobiales bacterium]